MSELHASVRTGFFVGSISEGVGLELVMADWEVLVVIIINVLMTSRKDHWGYKGLKRIV
jgi:hypothetical protein